MLGILGRLLGGATAPLIDQASSFAARLLRKVALFIVALICLIVVLIALTIAFDLWISTMAGPIVGALSVALLYFVIAAVALVLATRDGPRKSAASTPNEHASSGVGSSSDEDIDSFASPLLRMLGQLGLRREQMAVLAGSSLAKNIGPIPLVGLAIVAGFLIGRTWKAWRDLLSVDVVASLLSTFGMFGLGQTSPENEADQN